MKNKIIKEIREIFRKKALFRKNTANLPFDEKIRILIELQKMAVSFKRKTQNEKIVWKL